MAYLGFRAGWTEREGMDSFLKEQRFESIWKPQLLEAKNMVITKKLRKLVLIFFSGCLAAVLTAKNLILSMFYACLLPRSHHIIMTLKKLGMFF